ncbi:MAG: methyltransferase domain-containing protein [Cyanobacteriota bacterium]
MLNPQLVDNYLSILVESNTNNYNSKEKLYFYLNYLLGDIDFQSKKVLDVGGGLGLLSFYAAIQGANKVICLEPEDCGSTQGVNEQFKQTGAFLKFKNVELNLSTFQDYEPKEDKFDIVILHNSINHLDETACIHLKTDPQALNSYNLIFQKLNQLTNYQGILLIADCSRYNFYPLIKLKNPFCPYIEWEKHQSPFYWSKLLSEHGFQKESIKWTSFNQLGILGRVVLGNPIGAYFTTSHFLLKMKKNS